MKNLEPYLVSIGTSFLKRLLDPEYDRLAWHKTVRNIRSRPTQERILIESMLYALAALIEVQMGEQTAARQVLKSLLTDGASEIGTRLNRPITDAPAPEPIVSLPFKRIAWLDHATAHLKKPLF